MELYENIRRKRKELKMTQQQLADLTGYGDRSSIAKIESGQVDLSQSKLELFAKVLHTTPGDLMGHDVSVTSDLPSNILTPAEQSLLTDFRQLNDDGQEKVCEYTSDLVASGRYDPGAGDSAGSGSSEESA